MPIPGPRTDPAATGGLLPEHRTAHATRDAVLKRSHDPSLHRSTVFWRTLDRAKGNGGPAPDADIALEYALDIAIERLPTKTARHKKNASD